MSEFDTTKVEYKITTSVEGFCPHCHGDLNSSKTEEMSDDYPPKDYWIKLHELFVKIPRKGDNKEEWEDYHNYIKDNPIFVNFYNLYDTWKDRIKEMPIKHIIKSETIYVIKGTCFYCNKEVELRHPHAVIYYSPPIMNPGEQMEVRQIHECPYCKNNIIAENGEFKHGQVTIDNSKRGWTTGQIRGTKKLHRCPICYGQTTVPASLYSGDNEDIEKVECKSCEGKGYISD